MDGDCISGQIRRVTKGSEKKTRRMEKARFIMWMGMCLKDIGLMIKPVELVCIRM